MAAGALQHVVRAPPRAVASPLAARSCDQAASGASKASARTAACRRGPDETPGPVHGLGLARPTITDVVQWKMDDSFDMHQFTSLCRNI